MMRRPAARSGQIMPMVALMMVVILGMAAFAIDGSNNYSQHRRFQADLDVAVKVAAAQLSDTSFLTQAITSGAAVLAADGYPNTLTGITSVSGACVSDGSAGVTFCSPPTTSTSPFSANNTCIEGFLSRDVGGFFGGVIGIAKTHINVRAVACKGGYHQPYAMIGMCASSATCPGPSNCSIAVQNTAATLVVTGSIVGDSQDCNHGTAIVNGVVDESSTSAPSNPYQPITGTQGTFAVAPIPDPFTPISLSVSSAVAPTTVCASGCTSTSFTTLGSCSAALNYLTSGSTPSPNATYWFPPDNGSAPVLVSNFHVTSGNGSLSNPAQYFMPHCDGSPAVYLFSNNTADMWISGNSNVSITSFDTTFVLDMISNPLIDAGGGALWQLNAPTSGPYAGIAISAHTTQVQPPCPTSPSPTNSPFQININGSAGTEIFGVLDAPCSVVTLTGNSQNSPPTPFIDGAAVGFQILAAGNNTTTIRYDPSNTPASYGSALVE